MVEEPIPGEGEPELRPQLLNSDGLQPAHRGALELFQGAEGPEIVGAAQILGGQAHGCHVQGLLDVVEVVPLKDVGQLAVPNAVDVGLTGAGEAGVEPGLHLLQRNGPNVRRQVPPQASQDFLRLQIGFGPEGGHLHLGVGPGVGPAGAGHLHRLVQQAGEQGFQFPLDGLFGVPLLLPPLPAGAVIA